MSYQAKWTVSGTTLDDSANALTKAQASLDNGTILKKYEQRLNDNFKEHIRTNLRRSGVESDTFQDVFFLQISDNNISFINTEPLITSRYEYGYSEDEYDTGYMIQTSPRYFIRPAIQESLKEVQSILKY